MNTATTSERGRGYSAGSIDEYLKRKRQEIEAEQNTPAKNKKTSTDTEKDSKRGAEMEEIKKLILNMTTELKSEIRNNNQEIRKNSDDLKSLREEMLKREEAWKKEREEWNEEKSKLTQRIKNLENIVEKQERIDRKNNIVIKGI